MDTKTCLRCSGAGTLLRIKRDIPISETQTQCCNYVIPVRYFIEISCECCDGAGRICVVGEERFA